MSLLTITNTHKVIEKLQTRGASRELAEGIVETIQAARLDSEPATKADLAELRSSLIMWVLGIQIAATGLLLASRLFTG